MSEPIFTDPIAQEFYHQGASELELAQSAEAVLRTAESCARRDARADIMQSAFYYLAAANFLESRNPAAAAQAFHQAGYQLHRLELCTQAGRAYSSAGRLAERAAQSVSSSQAKHDLQHFAVRSYSRANHSFAEAGELEWSETEYVNERNARVTWAQMQGKHPWAQLAWKATSNYGTSLTRWSQWVVGTIGFFSLLYELFYRLDCFVPMETGRTASWIPLWSGLYYSVNVTAALGLVDYQPSTMISQGVVMLNVLIGYILLGIGIGIIGRIVKTRS